MVNGAPEGLLAMGRRHKIHHFTVQKVVNALPAAILEKGVRQEYGWVHLEKPINKAHTFIRCCANPAVWNAAVDVSYW